MDHGSFVISLDFELLWGVRDKKSITTYGQNIKNEHIVIPQMLELFSKYGIHATWATVGFIFADSKGVIKEHMPDNQPSYINQHLSPYNDIDKIGDGYDSDPYHYGSNLIQRIKSVPNQELATHTFSHYYCLEDGQTIDQFVSDIKAALTIANGYQINSIVFPRNQYSDKYLQVCADLGIKVYRGNENHWAYIPHNGNDNTKIKRVYRLLDSYFNLSGHHVTRSLQVKNSMMNIPASRFLRPYSTKLRLFEPLKLKRILNSMEYAAKTNSIYHLWWHPHNFGSNMAQNLKQLEMILKHFINLQQRYKMESKSMEEFYGEV